jgi:hypothetical protein
MNINAWVRAPISFLFGIGVGAALATVACEKRWTRVASAETVNVPTRWVTTRGEPVMGEYREAARHSAIADLPCSPDRIDLHRLYSRGDLYVADGCGQRVLYGEEDGHDDHTGATTLPRLNAFKVVVVTTHAEAITCAGVRCRPRKCVSPSSELSVARRNHSPEVPQILRVRISIW